MLDIHARMGKTASPMSPKKIRLDKLLLSRGMVSGRHQAQSLIMAGQVRVDGTPVDKAGHPVSESSEIRITGGMCPYVSRGGLKLEQALHSFDLSAGAQVCLDVGASTGGFTDCLLQNGAARVYAVDVGYGQLAWRLRQDSRVTVIERMNIRCMPQDMLPEPVDLVTIDVSFISLKIVVPAVAKFMKPNARIVALIKPQFEVGKGQVGKGGIVRDPLQHDRVLSELSQFFSDTGWTSHPPVPSPVLGSKGNQEFLILLSPVPSYVHPE